MHLLLSYLTVYARWFVGGLLLMASIAKASNIAEFASTIELFRLTPRPLSRFIAISVIGLELAAGLGLIAGLGMHLAILIAVGLFSLFALAIAINLIRQNLVNCTCFGPYFREKISWRTLVRNVLLISLCLVVGRVYDGFFTVESLLFRK